jgi:hypothetical protein
MFKPTIKPNRTIRSAQVLEALISILRPHLPLDLRDTRITADDMVYVLAYASVHQLSIDSACKELEQAPSANRFREVLGLTAWLTGATPQAEHPVEPALGRRLAATKPLAIGANEPGPDTHDSLQDGPGAFDLHVMFAPRRMPSR